MCQSCIVRCIVLKNYNIYSVALRKYLPFITIFQSTQEKLSEDSRLQVISSERGRALLAMVEFCSG